MKKNYFFFEPCAIIFASTFGIISPHIIFSEYSAPLQDGHLKLNNRIPSLLPSFNSEQSGLGQQGFPYPIAYYQSSTIILYVDNHEVFILRTTGMLVGKYQGQRRRFF